MSQQELFPESQSSQSYTKDQVSDEGEIHQPHYPYHWSGRLDNQAAPRDELPSGYSEPAAQQGYEGYYAQSNATSDFQQANSGNSRKYGPDGDAFEQAYGPYNRFRGGQSVPRWAQAQPQRRGSFKWPLLLILGLFLIKPMLILVAFIGVAIFALVLPFLLVAGVIGIVMMLFRLSSWQGRYRHRRNFHYWYPRGPWGL